MSKFEDCFWSIYPRREGKAACLKKWVAKKLDDKAEQIRGHLLNRVKDDKKWKDGYVPMPLTFLNGDRWEDEYERVTGRRDDKPARAPEALQPPPQSCNIKAALNCIVMSVLRRAFGTDNDTLREVMRYRNRVAVDLKAMGEINREDGIALSTLFRDSVEAMIRDARKAQ